MTAIVGDLITSVRGILLDPTPTTWLDPLMADWLNDVLAAAANLKRDINPQVISVPLVAGSIQTIPATALVLLEPYFNGSTGSPGAAVTLSPMTPLNRRVPSWRATTPTASVTDIFPDERSPTIFHCYPPNNGSGAIMALCGVIPFIPLTTTGLYPLNTSTVAIPIPDNYREAIVDGLVSKALAAQTRRQDVAKSTSFWQRFEAGIVGGKMGQREVVAQFDDKEEK